MAAVKKVLKVFRKEKHEILLTTKHFMQPSL